MMSDVLMYLSASGEIAKNNVNKNHYDPPFTFYSSVAGPDFFSRYFADMDPHPSTLVGGPNSVPVKRICRDGIRLKESYKAWLRIQIRVL